MALLVPSEMPSIASLSEVQSWIKKFPFTLVDMRAHFQFLFLWGFFVCFLTSCLFLQKQMCLIRAPTTEDCSLAMLCPDPGCYLWIMQNFSSSEPPLCIYWGLCYNLKAFQLLLPPISVLLTCHWWFSKVIFQRSLLPTSLHLELFSNEPNYGVWEVPIARSLHRKGSFFLKTESLPISPTF